MPFSLPSHRCGPQAELDTHEAWALRHCHGQAEPPLLCAEIKEDVDRLRAQLSKSASSGVSRPGVCWPYRAIPPRDASGLGNPCRIDLVRVEGWETSQIAHGFKCRSSFHRHHVDKSYIAGEAWGSLSASTNSPYFHLPSPPPLRLVAWQTSSRSTCGIYLAWASWEMPCTASRATRGSGLTTSSWRISRASSQRYWCGPDASRYLNLNSNISTFLSVIHLHQAMI